MPSSPGLRRTLVGQAQRALVEEWLDGAAGPPARVLDKLAAPGGMAEMTAAAWPR